MYFCPKCSYLFDISKLTSTINLDDTRILIDKIPEIDKCKNIIDFSLDIPNIINYAFKTCDYVLINLIINTYQLRSILNNLYLSNNTDINENKNHLSIDKRHNHVINIYKTNINNYINVDNYISIIE